MKNLLGTLGKSACLLTLGVTSAFASQEYIVKLKDGASLAQHKSFTSVETLGVSFGNFVKVTGENIDKEMISANPEVL